MANLTRRFSWKKWAPDIGENRELPEPVLYLEIATGLTQAQLDAIGEQLRSARQLQLEPPDVEALPPEERGKAVEETLRAFVAKLRGVMVSALGAFVRVHGGPHTVDGRPLATLDDYLALAEEAADRGVRARAELEAAVVSFNSVEGPDELFSLRRSGGRASTPTRSAASEGSATAGR